MSHCKQSASEFIQSTFSPHVAVLCSADAQLICRKNNLTFVQLIQPFCRLTSDVHVRDPNNVSHSIHNMRINVCDMVAQPPQQNVIKKQLSDVVASTYEKTVAPGNSNVISVGNYDLQYNASTPWFEVWREAFLQVLPPADHEYLNHCLACIFVVASSNGDPLSMFTTLTNQQAIQQQQFPNRHPRWFCPGILHYYLLLHDVVDGDQTRAEAIYKSMKAMYGAHTCCLLHINSRSLTLVESNKSSISALPDPWNHFLSRPLITMENDFHPSADGLSIQCSERYQDKNSKSLLTSSIYDHVIEETGSLGITSSSSCDLLNHPLASPATSNRDTPSPDSDPTAAAGGYLGEGRRQSSSFHRSTDRSQNKPHGMCLTPSDLDRLRVFMQEFVVSSLVPWVERQMKDLNEQLVSRKGIHRSFFSATKKWFVNKPSGPIPVSQNTTVVYTKDAPELQLRRLADLAFLFQMYSFAYSTYHMVKKDFNNDLAWLHFAGALEMTSLSMFLQGPQGQHQYPHHYMETAISTYLTSCRNPQYAIRTLLLSTEVLKKKTMYNEAAKQFLKMTSEPDFDSDLTSALFLEQAAHCFLALHSPLVRKYSFHMVLAGSRFNKAGQRKHSLRCYTQALQVYKGKHWSIAEDHIHFTMGKQSLNLQQLESSTAAFKQLLTKESNQSCSQQAIFLREYIFAYQLLCQEERDSSTYGHLPELMLPVVDSNASKVLLGASTAEVSSRKTLASGVWFDSDTENQETWKLLEEKLAKAAGQQYKPYPQLFTNTTNNSDSPVTFVGEPITVEVQIENPLRIMLVLSDVSLLWAFLPSIRGSNSQQVISNEVTTAVKNNLADEIIQTSVIKEVVVQGLQSEHVHLTLTPRQPGQLRVAGLAYNLCANSITQNASLEETDQSTNQIRQSYTASMLVRGKLKLEPQGPRLNATKEELTGKLYGPDRRLDLHVYEEMPILEVAFLDFPEHLLCGEVQCIKIEFTNVGKSSLRSLKVTSTQPRFFTFGRDSDLPKYPYVYQMRASQCASLSSALTSTVSGRDEFLAFPYVLSLPLSNGELRPGETISRSIWLRGDDLGGFHEVDFLFYYEPLMHSSSIRYRVLRHRAVLRTVDSLSARVLVTRPAARVGSISGQELNSCVFSCELENLSQVHVQRPHVHELQVTQVSCVSPQWTLVSVGSKHHSGVRLGSRETLHLVLKGIKQGQEQGSTDLVFSEITFDREQVNTSCSPCSDLFASSWLHHQNLATESSPDGTSFADKISKKNKKDSVQSTSLTNIKELMQLVSVNRNDSTKLDSATFLKITLIFLWKAYVVQESGQMRIVVGQNHVHLERLNTLTLSYSVPRAISCKKPVFTRNGDDEKLPPFSTVSTSMVTYSFTHPSQKEHNFVNGICIVPVWLSIINNTDSELCIMVDTNKSPEILSSSNLTPKSVKWFGLNQVKLTLGKGQSSQSALKVVITNPGIYNLNTVSVFVTFSFDQSQMVLQKHATPSIITVVDVG